MTNTSAGWNDPLSQAPAGGALELIARLAAALVEMPMAAVCHCSAAGEWSMSGTGFPPEWADRELPEASSVVGSGTAVCRDYAAGEHPIAGVRFAVAIPCSGADESRVLVAMDRRPRQLSGEEWAALQSLCTLIADAGRVRRPPVATRSDLAFTLDLSGRFTSVQSGLELTGYSESELIGSPVLGYLPAQQRQTAQDHLLAQFGGATGAFDLLFRTRWGRYLTLGCRTRLLFEQGRPVGIELSCRDNTTVDPVRDQRRETERELSVKAAQLAAFSEHLRQLHRLTVARHEHIHDLYRDYLETGCLILGLPTGRVRDAHGEVVYPLHQTGFMAAVSVPLAAAERPLGTLEFGWSGPREAFATTAHHRDVLDLMAQGLGHAIYTAGLERERARLTDHLAHQLRHDPLTGLPNRLGLFEHLDRVLPADRGDRGRVGLLFVDLDQFKQINDTLGHSSGDDLLRQVAARMTAQLAAGDFVARIGGDEFTFVIAGSSSDDEIATRVRSLLDVIRVPYIVNDYELFLTASIGVAVHPRDGLEPKILIQRADSAMYRAKDHGKNDYEFYRPEMTEPTFDRLELETQLRRAMDNGELDMRFQPILDTAGSLDGLEVLLAWDNPKFGDVGPSRFIPIAEETGMIISIGRWVLRNACLQSVAWSRAGYIPPRIAVNVSALQFGRADFVTMVAQVLEETGLPPQCLELELTESLVMRDVEESARRMIRLRELGVSMSIDDFGTGYSSLSYLSRLPVDSLKIDRSFLAELTSSSGSLPLIQTIVVLAHNMGLSVVAEGVETEEQFKILREVGCDRVQGHLFGEALRAHAIPPLLRRARQRGVQ